MVEWKKKGKGQQKLEHEPYMKRKVPKWKGPADLREKYKQLKAGIITEDALTDEEIVLLRKYYGMV